MEFNFKVRRIIEKDWSYLNDWWVGYPGWEDGIDRDMMPENGLGGFIVDKDGYPVAALWLHMANSKTAIANPFVANPLYRDNDRQEALDVLLKFTTQFARDMGKKYVWSFTGFKPQADAFERNGYTITEHAHEIFINLEE